MKYDTLEFAIKANKVDSLKALKTIRTNFELITEKEKTLAGTPLSSLSSYIDEKILEELEVVSITDIPSSLCGLRCMADDTERLCVRLKTQAEASSKYLLHLNELIKEKGEQHV